MRTLPHGLRGALLAIALLAGTARASGGFLGVDVNDAQDGVRILSVRDGSAAASAGLATGDIVAAVGDRTIATLDDLSDALAKSSPGETVTLKVRRNGADQKIDVTLGARPAAAVASTTPPADAPTALPAIPLIPAPAEQTPAPPAPPAPPEIGLATKAIPAAPATVAMQDAPRKGGFLGVTLDGSSGPDTVIGSVVDGSPAANAKLKVGDQIVAIDGVEVATADAISAELSKKAPGDDVEIAVLRDGQRKLRTAKLGSYGSIGFPDGAMAPVPAAPAPSMEKPEKRAKKDAPAGVVVRSKKAPGKDPQDEAKKPAGRGWLGVYLSMDDGVTIDSTADGGPAEGAGFKAGDRILKVGDRKIETTEDLLSALEGKAGEDVAILVKRDGAEKRIGVTLGSPPTDVAVAAPMPARPEKSESKQKTESKKTDEPVAAKAKKKPDGATADAAQEKALAAEKRAQAQVEKAEKRAKEAAAQAEKRAKDAAKQAEKRAKAAADKAIAKARDAQKAEKAGTKKKSDASPSATWFFPTGTELSVRIEEKDGGYWITSGSGKQGIEVPADAITNLSIEAKGGGVEVRVHGGSPHTMTVFSSGSDGHHAFVAPKVEGGAVTTWKADDHGNLTILGSTEGTEPKIFTFDANQGDGDIERHVIRLRKGDEHGMPVIIERSREGGGDAKVEVKKGEVHVVPHPPAGGGIVIHNNGGTVIIGDAAAHAYFAREGNAKPKEKVKVKKDTD